MNELHDMLDALGVRVEYSKHLPRDRDGEYIHDRRLIRLRSGMAERLHRSVLAHEVAHAVFADVPSMLGPVNAKQERRADEWAALRLITPEAYRRAESLHGSHNGALAVELGVITRIVAAYQRILARIGNTVYVAPRMGGGQYHHSERVA